MFSVYDMILTIVLFVPGGVMSFDKVLLFARVYKFGMGIACFLAVIQMLRLLRLNKYIAILGATMKSCWLQTIPI